MSGLVQPNNAYRRWSAAMDAELVALLEQEMPIDVIAERMQRTRTAILHRIGKLWDERFLGGVL